MPTKETPHILTQIFGVRYLHQDHPVVQEWDDFYDPNKELIPQAYKLAEIMKEQELDFFAACLNHRITHAPHDIPDYVWDTMAQNVCLDHTVWHREEHPVYWKMVDLHKSETDTFKLEAMARAWLRHFVAYNTSYQDFKEITRTTWYEPIRSFLEKTSAKNRLIPQMKRRILSDTIEFPQELWTLEFINGVFNNDPIRFTDELRDLSYRIKKVPDYFKPLYWFVLATVNLDSGVTSTLKETTQMSKDLTNTLWTHLDTSPPSVWRMSIAMLLNKTTRSLICNKILSAAEIEKPSEFAEVKDKIDIAQSLKDEECSITELYQWIQTDMSIKNQDYTMLITEASLNS